MCIYIYILSFCLLIFRWRGGEVEREGENRVRETWTGCLSHTPELGTWPATQACALTEIEPATLQFTDWHSIH